MNTDTPHTMPETDEKTLFIPRKEAETRLCPFCEMPNTLEDLPKRDYRCGKCNQELAHVEYAPNGSIHGIFGWLLPVGEVFMDRYQVKQVLGKGGFGATYLVDDLRVAGKRRALKEVPETLYDHNETSLLGRLDHPAIPDIIDHMSANGMQYLILKFGGSRTLGSERKAYPDRRIPIAKLLPWMRQLCDVLTYLHLQNPPVIHRDLKPENILLNEDERIMLIDFGIAKEVSNERTRALAAAFSESFSSPEQIVGTGTDERADIYSLGATFYALLTGKNPPSSGIRASGEDLIPPSQIVEDVPPEVEAAILQALSLRKLDRQQSVKEFAVALGSGELEVTRPRLDEPTVRLPTGSGNLSSPRPTNTVATGQPPRPSMPIPPAKPDGNGAGRKVMVWVGASAALAVAAGVTYTVLRTPETPKPSSVIAQPDAQPKPQPPIAPAEASQPPATTTQPTPAPPKPETAAPPQQKTPAQQLVERLPQMKAGDANPGAYAPTLEQQLDQFLPPVNSLPLTLAQGGIYRESDSIKFKPVLPSAGSLHVFILEANGKATLIFPSQYAKNNQVGPGTVNLPNGKPPIIAGPPFGKSWLLAITTAEASNLYQQNAKDKVRVKDGLLELRIWEVLGFLQEHLDDPNTLAAGAQMHVCAKTGPCP